MTNSHPKPLISEVDWYAIACKIREENRQLKEKIHQLENTVNQQRKQIKVQVIKNQDYQSLTEQEKNKLIRLEIDNKGLKNRIKEQEKHIEQQKNNITELVQQLEKIEQTTVRLERECVLLQDDYNEQKSQLRELEKENQDLKIRVQRQQRLSIQYKTTLDKYMQNSPIKQENKSSINIESWSEKPSLTGEDNQENKIDSKVEQDKKQEEIKEENHQGNVNNYQEIDTSDNIENINRESGYTSLFPILDPPNPAPENVPNGKVEEVKEIKRDEPKKPRKSFLQLPQFGRSKKEE